MYLVLIGVHIVRRHCEETGQFVMYRKIGTFWNTLLTLNYIVTMIEVELMSETCDRCDT